MTTLTLKTKITEDMKTAMRAKDQARLSTVRMLLAQIKQIEIDQQITLDDTGVLAVINKMIKQRQDAMTQFQNAKRDDLAEKEQSEIELLNHYLPPALDEVEIDRLIAAAIHETNASSMKDMGQVMTILRPQLQGRADMAKVSQKLKQKLQ